MSYGTQPEAGGDPMRRPMDRCAFNGEGRMLGVLIVPLVPIVLITITLRWPTWKRGCRRGERSTAARFVARLRPQRDEAIEAGRWAGDGGAAPTLRYRASALDLQ